MLVIYDVRSDVATVLFTLDKYILTQIDPKRMDQMIGSEEYLRWGARRCISFSPKKKRYLFSAG